MVMKEAKEGYRLSPQQRREWTRRQSQYGGVSACVARLEGKVDEQRVRRAIEEVVSSQEILRSRYEQLEGMRTAVQVIGSDSEVRWGQVDVRGKSEQEQEQEVGRIYEEEMNREEMEAGPLVSATLVMRGEGKADMVLRVPVISSDSRSLINFIKHFSECYANPQRNAEQSVPYIRYAEWQNEMQGGEEADAAKQFWNSFDLGQLWRLKLPFERNSSPLSARRSLAFSINSVDRQLLLTAARANDITEDVLLLAAWQATLWRLSPLLHQVCISTLSHGRHHDLLDDAFGLFAREIPAFSLLEADMSLADLTHQIQQWLEQATEWEDFFDIDRAREDLSEGLSGRPVGYEYEQVGQSYEAGPLSVRILSLRSEAGRSKLLLRCEAREDDLRVELVYDEAVYTATDIERVSRYVKQMLRGLCRGERVGEVEIVGEQERRALVYELNETKEEGGRYASLQEMIEKQAEQSGARVAVVSGGEEMSYEEMNGRANQVGRYLRKRGVGPEEKVGLCVERGVEMVVGMLGIMKAGGAYVPLDPSYPQGRLSLMLQDTKPLVIVTQQHLVRFIPETEAEIICLDSDWGVLAQESDANLEVETSEENLAYILFTSGSTGRPKGVAVERRQLLNYVQSVSSRLDFPPNASFTTFSTFAADLGYTAVYPSLCLGGTLHIISQEQSLNPEALADYFSASGIDCLKTVPSHLKALQTISGAERIMPRRRLILGGEPSSREWVENLLDLNPECEIHNHYGPTEATVGVLTYKVERNVNGHNTRYVPLGRPIANTRIYLLDSRLQPTPFGVAGELHIGGEALARGYIGRPDLTAEKFIPDPFGKRPGARIYKTGDLAAYLPDGNIEFLGRNDEQVKVRGYRIETGEIEAILNQHPSVDGAAVLAKDGEAGEKRLVAYIASRQQPAPDVNDLRGFLKERLPEFMVPGSFAIMQALPLTANGKLDRKSLLALDETRPELTKAYIAPRNVIEEVLAHIWSEVLKVERVGIEDNFFDLGGHSLLAMQVLSRLRLIFQVDLTLRALFEAFTVADLAVAMVANEPKPGHVEKVSRALKKMESMSPEKMKEILQKRREVSEV